MEFRDERRQLFNLAVTTAYTPADIIKLAKTNRIAAPPDVIERWAKRFFDTRTITKNLAEPKLLNRFMIGADPEFAFLDAGGKYVYAGLVGLNTLEGFGADMSGRQAELRAAPSRFAVEVLASLVDTMRWLARTYPVSNLFWSPAAFVERDGCGGHIHFGRKQPDVHRQIANLDCITSVLLQSNVVDQRGQNTRLVKTNYGRYGDYRLQPHGYEYRTMPTWLCSPLHAYVTLVASKLAILHGVQPAAICDYKNYIINLFRAYQGRDDDARMALIAIQKRGFPVYKHQDFKASWGVLPYADKQSFYEVGQVAKIYFPPVIDPHLATIEQVFAYLVEGKPLPLLCQEPTWAPFHLQDDEFKISIVDHVYGLPDIAQGGLSKGTFVKLQGSGRENATQIYANKCELDQDAIQKAMKAEGLPPVLFRPMEKDRLCRASSNLLIYFPSNFGRDHNVDREMVKAYRDVFYKSGLFPMVKAGDIDKVDVAQFQTVKKKVIPKPLGKRLEDFAGSEVAHYAALDINAVNRRDVIGNPNQVEYALNPNNFQWEVAERQPNGLAEVVDRAREQRRQQAAQQRFFRRNVQFVNPEEQEEL